MGFPNRFLESIAMGRFSFFFSMCMSLSVPPAIPATDAMKNGVSSNRSKRKDQVELDYVVPFQTHCARMLRTISVGNMLVYGSYAKEEGAGD